MEDSVTWLISYILANTNNYNLDLWSCSDFYQLHWTMGERRLEWEPCGLKCSFREQIFAYFNGDRFQCFDCTDRVNKSNIDRKGILCIQERLLCHMIYDSDRKQFSIETRHNYLVTTCNLC